MSEKKPSTNKNIKKLKSCSWQQWVRENVEKQSSEPSGWAPSSQRTPKKMKKKKIAPRIKPSQKSLSNQDPRNKNQDDVEAAGKSCIKTTQVVKTVTREVQEKSAGIDFLTKRICKDVATDELDKMLSKKGSPTRRMKCSNMVSELTRGWKEMEKEKKQAQEGSGDNEDGSLHILRGKKDVEDANKINALSKKHSAVGNLKSRWQNWASEHTINQKLNPFSEDFDYEYSMLTRLRKGEEGYGRPKEGSKTAERARRAEAHIHREIDDMCFIIRTMEDPDPDGYTRVTFGDLFDRYVRISDKVVGILMRARKQGKVAERMMVSLLLC
uniref:Actin binding Rho activating protein b n=1 Tax=Sinocyclocheilus anshuiensis TaxID=1608454 RepID=A0A671KXB9_9TELE